MAIVKTRKQPVRVLPQAGYLVESVNLLPVLSDILTLVLGLNPVHSNTTLTPADWDKLLLIDDVWPVILSIREQMSKVSGTKEMDDALKLINNGVLYSAMVQRLGNGVSARHEVRLSHDGPLPLPISPIASNLAGGFASLFKTIAPWGGNPSYPGFGRGTTLAAPEKGVFEFLRGDEAVPKAIFDRGSPTYRTLTNTVQQVMVALQISISAADQAMWGPDIFGAQNRMNGNPAAVAAQKMSNVLMLTPWWRFQYPLIMAHALERILFSGATPVPELAAAMDRYDVSVISELRRKLSRVTALKVAPIYGFLGSFFGWGPSRDTSTGPARTLYVPSELRQYLPQEKNGINAGALVNFGPMKEFIDDMFAIVSNGYFVDQYSRVSSYFVASDPAAFVPPMGGLRDPALVQSDGFWISEVFHPAELWRRTFIMPNKWIGPLQDEDEFILTLTEEDVDDVKFTVPLPISLLDVEELGKVNPLQFRNFADYQGDIDIGGGISFDTSDEAMAGRFGLSVDAYKASKAKHVTRWAHLTPGSAWFSSSRTEVTPQMQWTPSYVVASSADRFRDGLPIGVNKGLDDNLKVEVRRWRIEVTTGETPMRSPFATVVDALLAAVSLNKGA